MELKHPAACGGVLTALLQSAGFQPAFAPRDGELNPQRTKQPPAKAGGCLVAQQKRLRLEVRIGAANPELRSGV